MTADRDTYMLDLIAKLAKAQGRIGALTVELQRTRGRCFNEAAARRLAEGRVAELEACLMFVQRELDMNGAPL